MEEIKKRKRVVKSKCLADALVWLGFEYTKEDDNFVFERDYIFDDIWIDLHSMREYLKRIGRIQSK